MVIKMIQQYTEADRKRLSELKELVFKSGFADIGFIDSMGRPSIRRVFCTWHRGLKAHLISTNTSSLHVQELMKNEKACLYFENSSQFKGLCLSGKVIVHHEPEYKELLWEEGNEKYYPQGVTDEDYCVLEFVADSGRYYMSLGKGDLTAEELEDGATEFKQYQA